MDRALLASATSDFWLTVIVAIIGAGAFVAVALITESVAPPASPTIASSSGAAPVSLQTQQSQAIGWGLVGLLYFLGRVVFLFEHIFWGPLVLRRVLGWLLVVAGYWAQERMQRRCP